MQDSAIETVVLEISVQWCTDETIFTATTPRNHRMTLNKRAATEKKDVVTKRLQALPHWPAFIHSLMHQSASHKWLIIHQL